MGDLAPLEAQERRAKELKDEFYAILCQFSTAVPITDGDEVILDFFCRKVAKLELECRMFTDAVS